MVRIGWLHQHVDTPQSQQIFSNVINWIFSTDIRIILVYGGDRVNVSASIKTRIANIQTYKNDWQWIENNLGSKIWAYDLLNEPEGYIWSDSNCLINCINVNSLSCNCWSSVAQNLINFYRTINTWKGIIVEGANYATDFGFDVNNPNSHFTPLLDIIGNNLVYQSHKYSWFNPAPSECINKSGNLPFCDDCTSSSNCCGYCDYNYWYTKFDTKWNKIYTHPNVRNPGGFFIGEFGFGYNQGSTNDNPFPWIPIWYDALLNYIQWRIPGSNFIIEKGGPSCIVRSVLCPANLISCQTFSLLNLANLKPIHCKALDLLYKPGGMMLKPSNY
jgi:hypothetical protein